MNCVYILKENATQFLQTQHLLPFLEYCLSFKPLSTRPRNKIVCLPFHEKKNHDGRSLFNLVWHMKSETAASLKTLEMFLKTNISTLL